MMNATVLPILQHTPGWVFGVLAVLILTGVQAFRPRVVPAWRLLLVPAIFIGWGVLSVVERSLLNPATSLNWIAAALLGSGVGLATTRLRGYSFERAGRVSVPGTPVTLIRTLTIFVVRYGLAVAAAFAVDAAARAQLVTIDVAVSGLSAGYFLGWMVRFAATLRARPLEVSRALIQLVTAVCVAVSLTSTPASAANYPVGEARISVAAPGDVRGDDSRQLHVIVWYPAVASAVAQPMIEGPPSAPLFQEGASAPDAAIAATPRAFPLIVASHGSGSTASEIGWFAAGLAAHGYVVAAVDHPGNNAIAPQTVAGVTMAWLRAGDLTRTIDAVLADARFTSRIDRAQIAAAGFSVGGYTVLELAGALSNLAAMQTYCVQKPASQVCSGQASNMPGVVQKSAALALTDPSYRAAQTHAGNSYRDPRVKAVFAMAPALGPELTPASLNAINIPVEIVAGFADPVVPITDNAVPIASAIPNVQLDLLRRPIGHYSFVTQCAPAGAARFAEVCGDSRAVRAKAHEEALALAQTFFATELVR
jgi:predicted dienelactone hydrolase